MNSVLLFNSAAGLAPRVKAEVDRLAHDERCHVLSADQWLHGDSIRAALRQQKTRRLVIAGGDGTLHRVINQLAPDFTGIEIGVVPCGTGNDFARSIGAREENLTRLCTDEHFGRLAWVDLFRAHQPSTQYCLNAATGGLGGEITSRIQEVDKKRWGGFAYWLSSLGKLADLHAFEIELSCDQHRLGMQAYGVIVSNGRFIGGGFPISPGAQLDDGLLDVTVIPVLPALDLLAAGLHFAIGLPEMSAKIQHHRAHKVKIKSSPPMAFSLDGENTAPMEASFETVPLAVKMVVFDTAPGFAPKKSRLANSGVDTSLAIPDLGWAAPTSAPPRRFESKSMEGS